MRTFFFLYILFFLILFYNCSEIVDTSLTDCPLPYDPSFVGDKPPIDCHTIYGISPDGEKLAFSLDEYYLKILNIKTGNVQNIFIDIKNKLPLNVKLSGCGKAIWCPYNSNRLLVHYSTYTDTVGDGKNYIYGQNLYIITLDGTELTRITPKMFGPSGSSKGFGIVSWFSKSNINDDYILFMGSRGVYNPQKDIFQNYTSENPASISPKDNYCLTLKLTTEILNGNPIDKFNFDINQVIFNFKDYISDVSFFNWSKDSKKLVFSVMPSDYDVSDQNRRFNEIWIMDVEKFLKEKPAIVPVQIINIRKLFCMYSCGLYATYLTDSTFAVSMFSAKDKFSYLYEITTDGRMVRQLTFSP